MPHARPSCSPATPSRESAGSSPARRPGGGPRGRRRVRRRAHPMRSAHTGGLRTSRGRVGPAAPTDHLPAPARRGPRPVHDLSRALSLRRRADRLGHRRPAAGGGDCGRRPPPPSPPHGQQPGRGIRPLPRGPRHPGPRRAGARLRPQRRVRSLAVPGAIAQSPGPPGTRHRAARPAQRPLDDRPHGRAQGGPPRPATPAPGPTAGRAGPAHNSWSWPGPGGERL